MRDPHVEALYFDLIPAQQAVTFSNPPPREWVPNHGRAKYRLEDGTLTAWLLVHTQNEEQARALVWPDLEAWEAAVELELNFAAIRFRYRSARIIDRDPPAHPWGEVAIKEESDTLAAFFGVQKVGLPEYPAPPAAFNAESEIVRDLMARYRQRAHEPLLSLAYALYTRVTYRAAGSDSAASKFRISRSVLNTLSRISSTRGGPLEARKFDEQNDLTPLTPAEREWVDKAIRAIILQVAAVEAGAEPELLAMDKLPPL